MYKCFKELIYLLELLTLNKIVLKIIAYYEYIILDG